MNVKNLQIDGRGGHLQSRHKVSIIISASGVCGCSRVVGGRCCCLSLGKGPPYLNRVTSRPHLASVMLY